MAHRNLNIYIIGQLLVLPPRFCGHHWWHDSMRHTPCAARVASKWLCLGGYLPFGVREFES
jgi:hypothetical protein